MVLNKSRISFLTVSIRVFLNVLINTLRAVSIACFINVWMGGGVEARLDSGKRLTIIWTVIGADQRQVGLFH